jgi:Domain of unknown function (DUF4937
MLLKWIVCQVHSEMRSAFSRTQDQWRSIENADGFVGQFGGWDTKNGRTDVCILGLWSSPSAYESCMRHLHDQVTAENQQERTYHQIALELFESHLPVLGQCGDLASAYAKGHFLRVADCQVKEGRVDHFIEVQKSIWVPGMRQSAGMLGGSFNRSSRASNRFLVITVGDSESWHDHYAREKLPDMRRKSPVADDTAAIMGRFVRLEDSWLIHPEHP